MAGGHFPGALCRETPSSLLVFPAGVCGSAVDVGRAEGAEVFLSRPKAGRQGGARGVPGCLVCRTVRLGSASLPVHLRDAPPRLVW